MRSTWWGMALAALLVASCSTDSSTDMVFDPSPDDGANGGGNDVTFTQVLDIFNGSCSCHRQGQSPNLGAAAYANIVGVASSTGMPYIDPGDTDNSYLYRKVAGASGIQGQRMPFGGPPFLLASQVEALAAWIEKGAPDD